MFWYLKTCYTFITFSYVPTHIYICNLAFLAFMCIKLKFKMLLKHFKSMITYNNLKNIIDNILKIIRKYFDDIIFTLF